jgi:hypothetical protein
LELSPTALLEFPQINNEKCTLTMYNSQGILVRKIENITTNKITIEKDNLMNGLFFVQLQSDQQIISTGKLIVE